VRRLLVAAIAVVAIVFTAALAAPFLVPGAVVKARVAALVRRQTGGDLRIAGPIRFSWLPRPRLTALDVALASPAGGFSTDFLKAPTVEIGLKPLALLRGAIEIDRLELLQPAIRFEIDGEGRRNWIFRGAATTGPGTKAGTDAGRPPAFGVLAIAGGEASYFDRRNGKKLVASGIDMTASLPRQDGALDAAGRAVYNQESVHFVLNLAAPEILRRGGVSGATLDMVSAQGSLAFRGEFGGAASPKATGLIDLKIPSMQSFLAWTRLAKGVRLSGPLSIVGWVEAGGPRLALTDAKIALDAMAAEGALTVERTAGRPMITGNLAIERLDLDPFIKPGQEAAPAGVAPAGVPPPPSAEAAPVAEASPPGWSRAAIDLAPLKRVDADVSLAATAIRVRRIAVGKSRMILHLSNGRLDLDIAAMALYGGNGAGKIVADGSGPVPAFGARLYLTGVTVRHLPLEIAGLGELSGAGDVSLDLIGRGKNLREIVESLNGIGGIVFADGTIGNAGLGPLMRDALGPAVDDPAIAREIDYSSLSGTATIARGTLRNRDLKLLSPRLSATAAGTLDLAARRIDYLLQPDIPGLGSARIAVTGSWDAPIYKALSVTITKGMKQPERQPR